MPARIFIGDGLEGQLHAACIPAGSLYLFFSPSWPWAMQPRGSSPWYMALLAESKPLESRMPVDQACASLLHFSLRKNKEQWLWQNM